MTAKTDIQALLRPDHWVNPTPSGRYNLVVLGGGTVGTATAVGAAMLGARVALVESQQLGGDRLNGGGVPGHILIEAARRAAAVRRGVVGPSVLADERVDFANLRDRIREARHRLAAGSGIPKLIEQGVDVFFGESQFADWNSIDVDSHRLQFARALIATGSRTAIPSIGGIAQTDLLTRENLMDLAELPRRLVILGGSAFGGEMAQAFARLGSEVTLIGAGVPFLGGVDPEPAAIVKAALIADGVRLQLDADITGVESKPSGTIAHARAEGRESRHECDRILLAMGTVPRIDQLNLAAAGVLCDEQGQLLVNDHLRTTNLRVFAAGSACPRYHTAHAEDALAHVVIANALFFGTARASRLLVPRCVFTDPQLACVGITEAKDPKVRSVRVALEELDQSVVAQYGPGFFKIHYDSRGRLLGAVVVSPEAADLIGEITLAMNHDIRMTSFVDNIRPYPTIADALGRAGADYRRTLLTPHMSRFLKKLLDWRR